MSFSNNDFSNDDYEEIQKENNTTADKHISINNKPHFFNNSNNDDSPLISLDIQINENESVLLNIMEDDNISQKVADFCKKHDLPQLIQEKIVQKVNEQIDNQINESKLIISIQYTTTLFTYTINTCFTVLTPQNNFTFKTFFSTQTNRLKSL